MLTWVLGVAMVAGGVTVLWERYGGLRLWPVSLAGWLLLTAPGTAFWLLLRKPTAESITLALAIGALIGIVCFVFDARTRSK
jgi:hypothetical protein